MTTEITEQALAAARQTWGDALIAISTAFDQRGIDAARTVAGAALDTAYGLTPGPFCLSRRWPTETDGTIPTAPLPTSLAIATITQMTAVLALKAGDLSFHKPLVTYTGDVAMWMGSVTFTDKNGTVLKVDKSWGYKMDQAGTLRIVLHHSSLPYQPE